MLSEVLDYVNKKVVVEKENLHNITYSHFEVGNEVLLTNIDDEIFHCKRFNPTTGVKSNRVVAINKIQIIELAINPFKIGFGIVLEVYSLQGLCKIKYNKKYAGKVTLTLHSNHILHYEVADSLRFIEALKTQMYQLGLKGDVTKNAVDAKHIETATSFFEATKEIEAQFSLNPSYKLIEKIMDLLREAVEQFAEGSDDQYLTVIKHIQNFLQREDVTFILDSQCKPKDESPPIIISDDDLCIQPMENIEKTLELSPLKIEDNQLVDSKVHSSENIVSKSSTKNDEKYASIIEKEFAALMSDNLTLKERSLSEEDITEECFSFKSDGIESELKSMLGDMTEEFDVLVNSFEITPSKDFENNENLDSKSEELDMDECDVLIRDTVDPQKNLFD